MEKWKTEYDNITVPENLKEQMEETIMRAKQEKRNMKKGRMWKNVASAAAVFAVLLVLPNTSQTVAAAMHEIPLLGDFFQVVTIREYQVENEKNSAEVKVPEVKTDEAALEAVGSNTDEAAELAKESAAIINFDVQKVTDELIAEFKEAMEEQGENGYQELYIDSEVLTDNEKWFSLELVLYQGAGSGYERQKHYTVDKTTGKLAELSDFYGESYVETVSEKIKVQMQEQMEADENIMYWLDNEEVSEWNFKEISEEQDFYVNAEDQVVICFDEYEVAPGYMGCVEFVLE